MTHSEITSDNIRYQDEESYKFSDRYEGFLTLLNDRTWAVEVFDTVSETSFYPVEPTSCAFDAMKYAESWVQVVSASDCFRWELGKKQLVK